VRLIKLLNRRPALTQLHLHYWQYFVALEADLERTTRFVEPTEENFGTFSVEFARILLAAGSEVDVLAKVLCETHGLVITPKNIDGYRAALVPHFQGLSNLQIQVPRYTLALLPWQDWSDGKNPTWWRAYNDVKHERGKNFQSATLFNALNAVAGVFVLACYLYHRELRANTTRPWPVLLSLDPQFNSRERSDLRPGYILPDFRDQ
jgi:hypothetical protein